MYIIVFFNLNKGPPGVPVYMTEQGDVTSQPLDQPGRRRRQVGPPGMSHDSHMII